jgi:uncharacterized protein
MTGVTDLNQLLRDMTPELDGEIYGYAVVPLEQALPPVDQVFAIIREEEGMTVVATHMVLQGIGLQPTEQWARISLKIHSSLSAVGLTAAFATALGKYGISANVIAGFHHDHIFVQWDRRHDAMQALLELSKIN